MLTAAGTIADRVDGLNLGAYVLTKPFAFARSPGCGRWPGGAGPARRGGSVRPYSTGAAAGEQPAGSPCPARRWAYWRCCWPPGGRGHRRGTARTAVGRERRAATHTVTVTVARLRRKLAAGTWSTDIGFGYRLP